MKTVYIFGAGASHSYTQSSTGVRPPLARNFFRILNSLAISDDFEVRVGTIVNYVRDRYGLAPHEFDRFDVDIEIFMTTLDTLLRNTVDRVRNEPPSQELFGTFFQQAKAYDEMVFLFAHILNEIQNGAVCAQYLKLLAGISPNDVLISLNWDTLLDRALYESGTWLPDTGYGISFRGILDNRWREASTSPPRLRYLKLHGSTNWLVKYITYDLNSGRRTILAARPSDSDTISVSMDMNFARGINKLLRWNPEVHAIQYSGIPLSSNKHVLNDIYCFVAGSEPFSTYKDRFRYGYSPFSYFFPPNDPVDDIPLMPLLVAPVKFKLYEEFAPILDPLWKVAEEEAVSADRITMIGYSLPETDNRIRNILKRAALEGWSQLCLVDPNPKPLVRRVKQIGFSRKRIEVISSTFDQYLTTL